MLLVAIAWLLPDATRSAPAQALLDSPPAIDETGNGALLLEGLRSVTAEEVRSVAQRYFSDDSLNAARLEPQPPAPPRPRSPLAPAHH